MVDHDQNGIKTSGGREIGDKIHREMSEWGNSGGINGDKRRGRRVSVSLHLLTKGATFNVLTDIGTHSWPPVISFNEYFSFETASVTCGEVVMAFLEYSKAGRRNDISTILVIKDV
jgi:hypothetical protein